MEWISVKEKLPGKAMTVIAYRHRTKQFVFAEYAGDCWMLHGGIIAKNAVSHWMPLPEPPKSN